MTGRTNVWVKTLSAGVLWSASFAVVAAGGNGPDLTGLSIEQLMNVEVSSASRFPQKTVQAPASVTVITAADIRDYGYRTLADILRSVSGTYVTYDRN